MKKNYYIIQGNELYLGTVQTPEELFNKANPQPILAGGNWDIVGDTIYFYGETSKDYQPSLLLIKNCVQNGKMPKNIQPLKKKFSVFPSYLLAKKFGVII